jgi:type II secretory pathway predicted ATPase ExeA
MSRYQAFGLRRDPFVPGPDLRFTAPAIGQQDCLDRLRHAVDERAGLAIVLAGPGLGKSTVRAAFAADYLAHPNVTLVALTDPADWRTDIAFLRAIGAAAGEEPKGRSALDLVVDLGSVLAAERATDRWPTLVIDDAHRLTSSQLDLLRTLLGPEETPPALTVVLFGEAEMEERILRRRGLARRLAMRHTLNPLGPRDAATLIDHRLAAAGYAAGAAPLFDADALATVVARSGGVPGLLVSLASACLAEASVRGRTVIDGQIARAAVGRALDPGQPANGEQLAMWNDT